MINLHADQPAIQDLTDRMTKTSYQKWQEYGEGFNIDLAVDQRVEREAHHVSAIARQAEMQTVLPELSIEEWHNQRAANTEAHTGGDETHWVYDHLPLAT